MKFHVFFKSLIYRIIIRKIFGENLIYNLPLFRHISEYYIH